MIKNKSGDWKPRTGGGEMDEKHRGGNRLKVENIGDGKEKEE